MQPLLLKQHLALLQEAPQVQLSLGRKIALLSPDLILSPYPFPTTAAEQMPCSSAS